MSWLPAAMRPPVSFASSSSARGLIDEHLLIACGAVRVLELIDRVDVAAALRGRGGRRPFQPERIHRIDR